VRRIDTGRLGIPVYFSVCGVDAQQVELARKNRWARGLRAHRPRPAHVWNWRSGLGLGLSKKKKILSVVTILAWTGLGFPNLAIEGLVRLQVGIGNTLGNPRNLVGARASLGRSWPFGLGPWGQQGTLGAGSKEGTLVGPFLRGVLTGHFNGVSTGVPFQGGPNHLRGKKGPMFGQGAIKAKVGWNRSLGLGGPRG